MKILPAIDIFEGQAVRLTQGDYDKVTVFSPDPGSVAQEFMAAGADFLHLVDLDGARVGELSNFDVVQKIAGFGIDCQIGGGIRTLDRIRRYLDAGCTRVILGSAALDGEFLMAALDEFAEKIAVSVAAKDGKVAVWGWREVSELDSLEFCGRLDKRGVKTLIYTDISKDGAMAGTNLEVYRQLKGEIGADIIASGGISSLEEIAALRDMGIYGAILGKALYLGAIDLGEAIKIAVNSEQ